MSDQSLCQKCKKKNTCKFLVPRNYGKMVHCPTFKLKNRLSIRVERII